MLTTRRSVLASSTLVTSALVTNSFPALAQTASRLGVPSDARSFNDPSDQLMYQRTIEAVIWSMRAISDVFFRDSLFRDFGMNPGDVLVMSRPLVARHEVLTANNQVNYAGMPNDLTQGPWVLEIPESRCREHWKWPGSDPLD